MSFERALERIGRFEPWENFYRESHHEINGRKFTVRSFGLCHWKKIIFHWPDGREFYRLKRSMAAWFKRGDAKAPRTEMFFIQPRRRYVGPQNCFIEFCNLAMRHTRPGEKEFAEIGRVLALKKKVLALYARFYRRHFYGKIRKGG